MQSMSTTGTSTATQAVTTLDEQTTPAADSAERPLTTADRCDVCDAQAYVRVVMLTGELFFCGRPARPITRPTWTFSLRSALRFTEYHSLFLPDAAYPRS